jgi:redox-sensitive bicupin YhaK (pirin superfamily)
MSIRPVQRIVAAKPTLEGAGVRLHRAFGFGNTTDFDPFLLFDDFRNERPADYLAGFPWHPHRGIETITYVLAGTVAHGDSLGNTGALGAGDVQWMTAGSGILHQEMPQGDPQGRMHGFQLWANLPASLKMTTPRYQDVAAREIPTVTDDDGTSVRVIRWRASRRSRAIWTCRCPRGAGPGCRSTRAGTPSPTSSRGAAPSATRPSRSEC